MIFASRNKRSLKRRLLNLVWPEMGFRRAVRYTGYRLARISSSPHMIALGFAVGAFSAFTPLIGLHFVVAAIIALVLRASIVASALGTIIGNPLTLPLIWLASYDLGALLLGGKLRSHVDVVLPHHTHGMLFRDPLAFFSLVWKAVEPVFVPLVLGGAILGAVTAAVGYWLVRSTVMRFQEQRKLAIGKNRPQPQ